MQAMTGGRLKPALVVMLVAAYTVGGFALVLTTGHSSHLACNSSIPSRQEGSSISPPSSVTNRWSGDRCCWESPGEHCSEVSWP